MNPKFALLATIIGALTTNLQAQSAEVLAVQVSRLETEMGGNYQGALPNLFTMNLAVGNWNSGTAVLLRIPSPQNAWILPKAPRLAAFVDDTGKDLNRVPEGAAADTFGKRAPVSFVTNSETGDMYVCVASLRAPAQAATKITGEIEIDYFAGNPAATVTEPIEPKVGTVLTVGPFTVKILEVRERTAGEMSQPPTHQMQLPPTMRGLPPEGTPMPTLPPGQTLPPGMMTPEQISERINARPVSQAKASKRIAVKCELLTPEGSTWIPARLSVLDARNNVTKFRPEILNNSGFTFTFSIKELTPFRIKLEAVNTANAPTAKIKFSTSLGVSRD